VLVAAGMRVVGVVAGVNVLRGLPENRTSIGAALVDTASEVTTGVGIAVTGTILATLFTGDIATTNWSVHQTGQFEQAITIAGLVLTAVAAALVGWATARTRSAAGAPVEASAGAPVEASAGAPVEASAGAPVEASAGAPIGASAGASAEAAAASPGGESGQV
jgi:hypothetical protein